MKCAVCGKEFGTNNTCQYCGADKVTGLGNYSGYDVPNSGSFIAHNEPDYQGDFVQAKIKKVESMVCYACGEIIPADSRFCPHCSKELYVTCPKCGCEYSSQYPTCNKCGTNRNEYIKMQEEKRRKEEIERRKYEEWLNSPEGQAEQKRKEKEDMRGGLYVLDKVAILCGCFFCLIMFIVFIIADSTVGIKDDGTPLYVPYIGGIVPIIVGIVLYIVGYVFYRPRKQK